jgi:hypothetical protein
MLHARVGEQIPNEEEEKRMRQKKTTNQFFLGVIRTKQKLNIELKI